MDLKSPGSPASYLICRGVGFRDALLTPAGGVLPALACWMAFRVLVLG